MNENFKEAVNGSLCASPVRIYIPRQDVHYRRVTSPFPVRGILISGDDVWIAGKDGIPGESHRHSQ